MTNINLLKPNFKHVDIKGEEELELTKKFINRLSFKKPFEFKTTMEITQTEPVLTIKPLVLEKINYEDSEEEAKRKSNLNEKFYDNLKNFDIYLSDLGWIYYKRPDFSNEEVLNPFYKISDGSLEKMLKSMAMEGEIVEIPKLDTFCIKAEAELNLKSGFSEEIKKALAMSLIHKIENNYFCNMEDICKQLEDNSKIVFAAPVCSIFIIENHNKSIKMKYRSTEYKLPIDKSIFEFERNKLKLLKTHLIIFNKILGKSENLVDFQYKFYKMDDKLNNNAKEYIPFNIHEQIYFVADKIKRKELMANTMNKARAYLKEQYENNSNKNF